MLLEQRKCIDCGHTYFGGAGVECPACARKVKEEKLETHMAELRKLPLIERIERIEKLLYEQSQTKRINRSDLSF